MCWEGDVSGESIEGLHHPAPALYFVLWTRLEREENNENLTNNGAKTGNTQQSSKNKC